MIFGWEIIIQSTLQKGAQDCSEHILISEL